MFEPRVRIDARVGAISNADAQIAFDTPQRKQKPQCHCLPQTGRTPRRARASDAHDGAEALYVSVVDYFSRSDGYELSENPAGSTPTRPANSYIHNGQQYYCHGQHEQAMCAKRTESDERART